MYSFMWCLVDYYKFLPLTWFFFILKLWLLCEGTSFGWIPSIIFRVSRLSLVLSNQMVWSPLDQNKWNDCFDLFIKTPTWTLWHCTGFKDQNLENEYHNYYMFLPSVSFLQAKSHFPRKFQPKLSKLFKNN